MPIRHADARDDAANDADKALVRAADKEIVEVRSAINLFVGRAVDRTAVVPGEADNRGRSEHIGVEHAMTILGHKSGSRFGNAIIPSQLLDFVVMLVEAIPMFKVCKCCDTKGPFVEQRPLVVKVIGTTDHPAAHIARCARLRPIKSIGIVVKSNRATMAKLLGLHVKRCNRLTKA